ncbi:putative histone deacetylase [Phaeomoniella chlamydospora]|uniref:histone deacetylase n=1 Tax=Phaeomoniella chlamydospora TaxID=158046 RepID=A0A0G2GZ49_PHACM|nr:putative histone deacetylase [Phaeomoniella chlamydospora]
MDTSGDTLMGNMEVPGSSNMRTVNGSFQPPLSMEPTPLGSTPDISAETGSRLNISDDDDYQDSLDGWDDSAETENAGEKPPRLLPLAYLRTGLCYDDRMRYHAEMAATSDFHPEDPRRIYYIFKELCQAGLVDDPMAERPLVPNTLLRIDARFATREEICTIHTPEHFDFIQRTQFMEDDELLGLEQSMDSLYFNRLSFESALLSCGGAIETVKAVVTRQVKNAIAVIRPPGHHAEVDRPGGFCLFNNVPVASHVCRDLHPDTCRKILILDWDVHHGNGIQNAFYDDPNVLYISIHVYQDGKFYPGGPEGDMNYCGAGAGIGKNINIPWPTKGMGDGDYMFAFQQIVMPIAMEFSPDLVIIAAGFDAAAGDELGGCFVSPTCYAHMTHMLMTLAEGKVCVCLEGGYNFRSISKSALAVTRTLMGEPPDRLPPTAATNYAIKTVRNVARTQSKYWRCMFPQEPINDQVRGERMHDVLRDYQATHYWDQYRMNSLYVFRSELSQSFKDQVLATPNFEDKKNLLVIFHDPPDVIGVPDATTGKLVLHNTWLADEAQGIIKWAVDHGFGVIDVNIPPHISASSSSRTVEEPDVDKRKAMTEKLAFYLWENYIEVNDHDHVFLMGIGNAFYGIARLLAQKDTVYQNTSGVISFVADNPLLPIKNSDNPWLQKWYYDNSLVFIAPAHQAWITHSEKKVSKRYGNMIKSTRDRMPELLVTHRKEIFEFLAERAEIEIGDELEADASGDGMNNGEETESEKEGEKDPMIIKQENFSGDENGSANGTENGSAKRRNGSTSVITTSTNNLTVTAPRSTRSSIPPNSPSSLLVEPSTTNPTPSAGTPQPPTSAPSTDSFASTSGPTGSGSQAANP